MISNKPHIKKISSSIWICYDKYLTGVGSTVSACWLDYYLKANNY